MSRKQGKLRKLRKNIYILSITVPIPMIQDLVAKVAVAAVLIVARIQITVVLTAVTKEDITTET